MLNPVLEVAVGGAHRAVEPRRHEDAERRDAAGMHIHEPENFRLGKTERVENRAGLEIDPRRQIDDELHADGPLVLVVTRGQAEGLVELPADGADRAVANHGERSANIHPRRETVGGAALLVGALIHQAHADDLAVLDKSTGDRRGRPYLHGARAHHLGADPLHELAHREDEAVVLLEKRGCPRQFECVVLHGQRPLEGLQSGVGRPQCERPAAGADGIKQVGDVLGLDRRGHRNL